MLQSDLHNKTNTEKMSQEAWIKQGKLINDFPDEFLIECYKSLEKLEIKACRNVCVDDNFLPVIYNYMADNTPLYKQIFDPNFIDSDLNLNESDKNVLSKDLLNDLILKTMFDNLDTIILKFSNEETENITNFIENIVHLCIQNGKTDNILDIFNQFYTKIGIKELQEKRETLKKQQTQTKPKKTSIIDLFLIQNT